MRVLVMMQENFTLKSYDKAKSVRDESSLFLLTSQLHNVCRSFETMFSLPSAQKSVLASMNFAKTLVTERETAEVDMAFI
jgi:hypothetical protein